MKVVRRCLAGWLALGALVLSGCAAPSLAPVDAGVRQALAPTGTLRVGVYPGSPTSLVRDPKTGEKSGVALELGQALASRMAVPVQVVEFERVAQVVDAIKNGAVDFTFTNATEARARDVSFTQPVIQLELGYIVPANSAITHIAEVDRPGVRVGVTQGSSSQGTLGRLYKSAQLVPAPSVARAQEMLRRGEVQAYATNKAILNDMLGELPGFKILNGRWGEENMAIAVPQGRDMALPFLRQFATDAQDSGLLKAIVARSGLRGTVPRD